MTTASVSKGCFYFEGRKAKKRKTLDPGDYFTDDNGKVTEFRKLQWKTYQDCWKDVNRDIQDLQAEVNNKIFEDLVQFVKTAHLGFNLGNGDGSEKKRRMHEIPTAALITGVNTPDHSDMFCHLTTLLRDNITPYIASLGSKSCQNMKSAMSGLLSQFIGSAYHLDDDEDDNGRTDINVRRLPCTMPVLCVWYQDKTKKSSSPGKSTGKSPSKSRKHSTPSKRKSSAHFTQYPPMVLVLEDFENFSPHVLQDLILICSQYLSSLPIALIFGIATSVTAVHRLLPHTVSSVLSMEKFQALPATEYLAKVINKILLTPKHPFKLGDKVFQLLLDCFLYHDFSVLSFIRGVQFAMMDHFFEQPATVLCCQLSDAVERIKTFDSKALDQFRRLQSFRRYVEKQKPQEQKALLLDDKHFKGVLQQMIEQLWSYHADFHPIMHCMHILTFELPGHPMGKRIRELYAMCLQGDIVQSDNYQEAKKLLSLMARDELVTLLIKITSYIEEKDFENDEFDEITLQLDTFVAQFNSLDDLHEPAEIKEEERNEPSTTPKPGATKLYQLQQQLRESAKKKKMPSKYEVLRTKTLAYLEEVFGKYLRSPSALPMYEVFYYESVSTVRRHLNASPRAAIQTALTNPHYYLQCDCCEAEPVGIPVTSPDVCIAYKLHLECGRLINLYDWLQAFITVVGEDDEDEDVKKDKSQQSPDQVLHARFIRAVSELQFLGFIKPTKKKTDHVARLTWGGC
ncbi:origin recognition complex subunit 3-like [Ptychodera flava]|uniref:origin recognition complex subunit 3-like n=1 Tax=Ptychodera flava TaxID=63121 RepID=UPI003969FD71